MEGVHLTVEHTIEPQLNNEWLGLQKLEWLAGLVHYETGVDILVGDGKLSFDGIDHPGYYSIQLRSPKSLLMVKYNFQNAWNFINDVAEASRIKKMQLDETTVWIPKGIYKGKIVESTRSPSTYNG